jgi:hypothetical protein
VLFEDACVGCHGHYGALAARGMPQFAFSEEQAKAVYAFIVDSGWDAYDMQQASAPGDTQQQEIEP